MENNPFLKAIKSFHNDFSQIENKENILLEKKVALQDSLREAFSIKPSAIHNDGTLAKIIAELDEVIKKSFNRWDSELVNTLPMKELSELYADRIIFLVFGKVNAGKSSFVNFLSDLFPEDQIRRFRFNDGKIEYFSERFCEGVTETTVTIQGVELGSNLVLLDSPGLHSVTDKNGDLTRRFTDSADAILWLTSSTSPGQVQELNDLKNELEKKKPLQPIITRSDFLDENGWCEETDQPISTLKNKTPENRTLQEDDVITRLNEFDGIDKSKIKKTISISVHAYKKSMKNDETLNESGLSELYKHLVCIVDEANTYKVKKAEQQMLNFLNGSVLSSLQHDIKPIINKLTQETVATISQLNTKKQLLASSITFDVISEIPFIVNKHKDSGDKKAISNELNHIIESKINTALAQELSAFVAEIKKTTSSLSSDAIGEFESITIDIDQIKGNVTKGVSTFAAGAGGAWGGAVLGSMLLPGIGTAIGGLLGGLIGGAAGSAVGDYFVEIETIKESVGISTEKIIQKTTDSINKLLPKIIESTFDDAIKTIQPVKKICVELERIIDIFNNDINILKGHR